MSDVHARALLAELVSDLWWSWDPEARSLVEALDPIRYEALGHSPTAVLEELEHVPEEVAQALPAIVERARAYRGATETWAACEVPLLGRVAYLSMEFGLHEALRIYSGGLGILAGDHVRSASDLGLDFVAVGLLYRHGYFRQLIDRGEQVPAWPEVHTSKLPIEEVLVDGEPLRIEVPDGHETYRVRVWRVGVGRVSLFLLDADLPENPPHQRDVTGSLYGGDSRMRIRQEVLLGIGGIRALVALDQVPEVLHLNEGHCAFAPVEWMRQMVEAGASLGEAETFVRDHTVFTTHTPVPAGHDRFGWDLVNGVLGPWRDAMGWAHGALMDRGRKDPTDLAEPLNMTRLAMGLARATNGVSELHGEVSRQMFEDPTIGHVTNGVHPTFWMGDAAQRMLDEEVPGWREHLATGEPLVGLEGIRDARIAAMRSSQRNLLRGELARRQRVLIEDDALIVGFARRFAPYKRADLLLTDPDRLEALLDAGMRFVFAGKAHPKDTAGRALLSRILSAARAPRFHGRLLFAQGYGIELGRRMTQGCDVWLNNPRRPREASGTSGQKVVLNGGLNASVLDGWWPEGYDGTGGWAIGEPREFDTIEEQDAADAISLYEVLEDVLATWQDRSAWNQRIRSSMARGIPAFNTHRMVADYARTVYSSAAVSSQVPMAGSVSSQSSSFGT
ncbi:MAG: glycosyltransferase family 1 protein [Proteobacteria bacterium]|nr:glycosyltransferase family 1 protein [Pseudomonadota bacterium]MCP4917206.1 glycosyltransferase family 1 protein [Pseudomonadota bacterium]